MLEREHMLDEGRKPPSTIGWKEGKREHSGRRKERESMDAKEEGAHARWEGERRIYWVEWEEEIADRKEEGAHASSGV